MQARGIILKDNMVLLMHRRKNGEEYYVFPGGHMQQGESPLETVQREIFEETTVVCEDLKPAFEFFNHMKKKGESEYYFIGKWKSGTPTLSGEESRRNSDENFYEPMWVSFEDAKNLKIYSETAKEWLLKYVSKH